MRLALVHDWLTGMRGGEKVLEVLCERFPTAELFTLVHIPGSVSPTIERLRPHTSFLQHVPSVKRRYRAYLPLFPTAIEQFNLDGFDFVISVSHCCAKSVIRPGRGRHLCYCLTPMRYAWDQFESYFGVDRVGPFGSRLMRSLMARLARWDRDTSYRADRYVAISHHVAGRIRRYYNREATVLYPPVDTDFFRPEGAKATNGPALVVSALVPYKRVDLAIDACRLAGVPLAIVGDGPERKRLERLAGSAVQFLGRLPDHQVRELYCHASVVLLPGEEDFGIVPLEAQACGCPVVALARGGALETIAADTGVLVDEPTAPALADGIARALGTRFDAAAIRAHAERFGRRRFGDEIEGLVNQMLAAPWPGAVKEQAW